MSLHYDDDDENDNMTTTNIDDEIEEDNGVAADEEEEEEEQEAIEMVDEENATSIISSNINMQHLLAPPFECIFSRNTSLTDVRISSSSSSILASVFRGLAYNSSVQILQIGEMRATGETVDMDSSCAFAFKQMLVRNTTIHRLALQGFRWDNEQALRWVCEGLRCANKSLKVLELLQIEAAAAVSAPSIPTAGVGGRRENAEEAAGLFTSSHTTAAPVTNSSIPFDEETTYRSKLEKAEATASTNLMLAIASMVNLKRLCIISCQLADMSLATVGGDGDGDDDDKLFGNLTIQVHNRRHTRPAKRDQPPKLEELRLIDCELTGPSIQTLRHACANNSFLKILDCRGNQLEDESCHALGEILKTAKSLTKVILEDNNIGDDGLLTLCDILSSTTLQQLCLKGNSFGPNGVKTLARALHTNQHLEELDLSDNFIGDAGAQALGSMLKSNNAMRDLVLENATIGGQGIAGLCGGMQTNNTLQKLNLSGNPLGAEGVQALSALLRMQRRVTNNNNNNGSPGLSSLRLSSCQLGDSGVAVLARALEQNTVLQEIILPFNRFGDEGAKAIGHSLPNWTGLTSLQIQFNLFSEIGFEKIVDGLSRNFCLKSMYLLNAGPSNRRIDDLFQEMQHWIRLNRAGRRALHETLCSSLWPAVLSRASSAYSTDGIFFLLRERPDLLES